MQIIVKHGGYRSGNFSHHIELVDIEGALRQQGYRLTRVERGERDRHIPSINLNLRDGPADGTRLRLPVELHVEPYSGQTALNAKVTLIGLREQLAQRYGLKRGKELRVRVFLPNYDGEYLRPEQGAEDLPRQPDQRPRDRVMRQIAVRRGASAFRDGQLNRFQRRCAISGCALADVLEAAHLRAYRVEDDNARKNGILLRADLHTLFDLDLVAVEPKTHLIWIHDTVSERQYLRFHHQAVRYPLGGFDEDALRSRWAAFRSR